MTKPSLPQRIAVKAEVFSSYIHRQSITSIANKYGISSAVVHTLIHTSCLELVHNARVEDLEKKRVKIERLNNNLYRKALDLYEKALAQGDFDRANKALDAAVRVHESRIKLLLLEQKK